MRWQTNEKHAYCFHLVPINNISGSFNLLSEIEFKTTLFVTLRKHNTVQNHRRKWHTPLPPAVIRANERNCGVDGMLGNCKGVQTTNGLLIHHTSNIYRCVVVLCRIIIMTQTVGPKITQMFTILTIDKKTNFHMKSYFTVSWS